MAHLKHSHAKDGDIPGTVDLSGQEGDDTARGLALYPVPAEDPNDPLQWPAWKKLMILVTMSLFSFFSNTSLLGPGVYISIFAREFGISPAKASELISYPNIVYGCGTLLTVPAYLKFGRRPVMLGAIAVYLFGLVGCSYCHSFGSLMAARIISSLASGVCEALPVQLVNDIFFLHERGTKLGIYTVALCFGSSGSLYAGYMLNAGYSWRLFFWVESGFAALLLILAFLFVEETMYKRKLPEHHSDDDGTLVGEKGEAVEHVELAIDPAIPPRKNFLQTLKPWSSIDRDEEFFGTALRSFSHFLSPCVLWVVVTYGTYIGLGALTFNYTFPIKITAPPYNWSAENSGLIALAVIIGFGLAIPLTWSSDWLAARLTRRNNNIREAEFRLGVLLPACFIAPAGLILYGMTGQKDLHWMGYFAGVALVDWGGYFYFTITLAYAIDSYMANTSEMLIAMCVGKQLISFAFGLYVLDWVVERGYAAILSGAFTAVLLVNNLMFIVFMAYGKRIRSFYANSWLGVIHKRNTKHVMTA